MDRVAAAVRTPLEPVPIFCALWLSGQTASQQTPRQVTSGKPAVDYFISGDRMELPHRPRDILGAGEGPEEGAGGDFYSEQV